MSVRQGWWFIVVVLCAQPKWVSAAETSGMVPLRTNGELPIMHGSGLPKASPAGVLTDSNSDQKWHLDWFLGWQSNAIDAAAQETDELLILDGETSVLGLSLQYKLTPKWTVALQLEYLRHAAGRFDNVIDEWHDFFGFSQGDRPLQQQDQLRFLYQAANGESKLLEQRVDGLGDTQVDLAYQFYVATNMVASIRAGLNLPTGDADEVLGSDKLDGHIALQLGGQGDGRFKPFSWYGRLGYLRIGDSELFGIKTKKDVAFSTFGFAWQLNPKWQLKTQLDTNAAIFESQVAELNRAATQFSLGIAYRTQKQRLVEFYIAEDITVNRAPDFTVGVQSSWQF